MGSHGGDCRTRSRGKYSARLSHRTVAVGAKLNSLLCSVTAPLWVARTTPELELCPAGLVPSWEDAGSRTQSETSRMCPWQPNPPPERGHWLCFSRTLEGSWNPQAGETVPWTKAALCTDHKLPCPLGCSGTGARRESRPKHGSPFSHPCELGKGGSPEEVSGRVWRHF